MSQEQQAAESNYSRKQIVWAMVAIFVLYGMVSCFVQTLSIARPKMAADLGGMALYSWSVSIPSLFSAFATLIFGKLSDTYGRRIMLMVSMILLLVGTVLSAISPTFVFLISTIPEIPLDAQVQDRGTIKASAAPNASI